MLKNLLLIAISISVILSCTSTPDSDGSTQTTPAMKSSSGRAQELVKAEMDSGTTTHESETSEQQDAGGDLTPEERKVIERYIQNMTYMVYFHEDTEEDPIYMKNAVGMANEFLASKTIEAVDVEQIENIKKDQQRVYEEETGESISLLQWIAQKLNADVYIEIDGRTSGESSNGKYYGQANMTLKIFEASTGRLLGSVPWNSPKTYSTVDERSARTSAVQTSVHKAMPIAISQATAYMTKALKNGIKYEVIIQNTPDSRLMSDFRRSLKKKVKDVITVSQSKEETKYHIYIMGTIEDLVDTVYDVGDTIPGLADMEQVILRGKSVTFNSGL